MATRQQNRVSMLLSGKWARASALLMALSLFFRAVYYFGYKNFYDIGFIEVVFCALIPLILSSAYMVVLYALHRNAPGIYGLIGAALCAYLFIWSFYTGSFIRVILALAWYGIAAGIVIFTSSGRLQNRSLCVAAFVIPIVVRFFVFDIGRLGVFESINEASILFLLASLACFPMTLKFPRKSFEK